MTDPFDLPSVPSSVSPAPSAAGAEPDGAPCQARRLEAMGSLTGRIAHDFSNLLQVISGYADILQVLVASGSTDLARIGRASDAIRAATEQATALTRRLVVFSREDGGPERMVDVNGIVETVCRAPTLGDRCELRLVPAASLWPAVADPAQVAAALSAMLINAREAMPAGGLIVVRTGNVLLEDRHLALGEGVAVGRYVALSVSDPGTGMPPDVLARAMEPFFTTREPAGQRGLGLTLIDGFARRSGGAARIDSIAGRGTTVRLLLPAVDAEASGA